MKAFLQRHFSIVLGQPALQGENQVRAPGSRTGKIGAGARSKAASAPFLIPGHKEFAYGVARARSRVDGSAPVKEIAD